jgi:uncharacterized membrane protein
MSKSRVEAFSDGVFAIVMTLLVLDLHVPALIKPVTDGVLWSHLILLWPVFASFLLSFLVLSVFWLNHNFLFNAFIKEVDRTVNLLNILYLLFLVFVPFSANLFGEYPDNIPAALIYGFNILANVIVLRLMVAHVRRHPELGHEIQTRLAKQATIRTTLTLGSYLIGIICAFVYIPLSIFFYIFPLVFNIIPGTLNFFERLFGFEIA